MDKKKFKQILLISLLSIVFYLVLSNIGMLYKSVEKVIAVLNPIFMGMLIAFIFNVPLRFFENRVLKKAPIKPKAKRGLSILFAYLSVIIVIVAAVFLIIPQFSKSVSLLVENIPAYTKKIEALMNELKDTEGTMGTVVKAIFEAGEGALKSISSYISVFATKIINFTIDIASGFVNFLVSLIISIYILASKDKLGASVKRLVVAVSKPKAADHIFEVAKLSSEKFSSFITSQVFEGVLLGTLCCIGMLVIGLPYAFLIGVIIGMTALIPIVGAWVGTGVSALLILFESPIKALIFVVFILVLQQLDNNLIYPRVMGNAVGLDGLWIIVAVTIGGAVGGIFGMLVSVPLLSVIFVVADRILTKKENESADVKK